MGSKNPMAGFMGSVNKQTVFGVLLVLYVAVLNVPGSPAATGGGGFAFDHETHLRGRVGGLTKLADFKTALKFHSEHSGLPIVIDFSSEGCPPCKMIEPVMDSLALKFKKKVVMMKVDIGDAEPALREVFQVRSTPTFQFFLHGSKVAEFSGADAAKLTATVTALSNQVPPSRSAAPPP